MPSSELGERGRRTASDTGLGICGGASVMCAGEDDGDAEAEEEEETDMAEEDDDDEDDADSSSSLAAAAISATDSMICSIFTKTNKVCL